MLYHITYKKRKKKEELKRRRKKKNSQVFISYNFNLTLIELPDETNNNISQDINNTTNMHNHTTLSEMNLKGKKLR